MAKNKKVQEDSVIVLEVGAVMKLEGDSINIYDKDGVLRLKMKRQ